MKPANININDARLKADIRRVFASKRNVCPDVEDELTSFWNGLNHRRSRTMAMRVALAAIAVAAAILAFVFIPNRSSQAVRHSNIALFTAPADDRLSITGNVNGRKAMAMSDVTVKGNMITVSDRAKTNLQNIVKTPSGEFYTVTLPDGTTVKLNARSEFHFPTHFASDVREVYLKGEAYFNVHHDPAHPFIVKTDRLEAKALGTSFNVRAYASERTSVTLVEGKLEVTCGQGKSVMLRPDEQAAMTADGQMTTSSTDTYQYTEWQNGVFYFDDVPLSDILKELGRWYNVSVEVADKASLDERLHFVADRMSSVDEAIRNLNVIGHFTIVRKGNSIILK